MDDLRCLSCGFGFAWIRETFECIPCLHECTTCENASEYCLTCLGDRKLNIETHTCDCPAK